MEVGDVTTGVDDKNVISVHQHQSAQGRYLLWHRRLKNTVHKHQIINQTILLVNTNPHVGTPAVRKTVAPSSF